MITSSRLHPTPEPTTTRPAPDGPMVLASLGEPSTGSTAPTSSRTDTVFNPEPVDPSASDGPTGGGYQEFAGRRLP